MLNMATEASVMAVIRASRPTFRNSHDKAAFVVHAALMAAGYALTATGRAALTGSPPEGEEEVGIEGWNEFDDSYGFVYAKQTEKGEKRRALVKCLIIDNILAVHVMTLDRDQEPFNLEINVKDYVREDCGANVNYEKFYQNFNRLVEILNKSILNEFEPPPKTATSSSAARREDSGLAEVSYPEAQPYSPLVYPPVRSPGFDDVNPGPGAGFFPQRGRPFDGSMLVGPHDPRFGQPDRPELAYPGGIAGIPPGARYDPIGPPDVPGFEPGRFIRIPRRPGGGTHPDLEHFQGPNYF